ncbi:LacI family DNA-binding transcriptional regulator [Gryllotalpicola protaetiae]|nr:LacI family DNA-binding transcriptional regulator [Gryllotalpicola protaetiae]
MTNTLGGRPARPASMLDVARRAGVSQQTVSRVSNGSEAVKPETRERVLAAMAELGYRPNSAARALKSGRFMRIGVLMHNLNSFGASRMLEAINFEAARRGYSIELIAVSDPSTGEVTRALSRLDHEAVDGIVLRLDTHRSPEQDIGFPSGIPTVIVEGDSFDDRVAVDADQRQGAQLAVQHLLDLGHPTVWHVAGAEGYASAAERERAWRDTLAAAGRTAPALVRGDWSPESGYAAGKRLLQEPDVTAVFCANDQMALGVLRAFHEAGRAVPAEASVVGFDDTQESAYFWPPLTTVHQDLEGVGASAVTLLLAQIEDGPVAPGVRLTQNQLIVRKSTDAWNG